MSSPRLASLAVALAPLLVRCQPAPHTPAAPPAAPSTEASAQASAQASARASAAPPPATACRSPLPFSPAPARPAVVSPALPAPVLSGCQSVARRSRQRAAAFFRGYDPGERDAWLAPVLACYHAGQGAWALEITSSNARMQDNDSGLPPSIRGTIATMEVRPVYVKPDGATTPAAATLKVAGGTGRFILQATLETPRTFDWDGDGRAELYFQLTHAQEEGTAEAARLDRFYTFTLRDGAVREFAPAASKARRIEDIDGDGRPDLVLESPWVVEGPCGISSVFYPGPERLLHSLPGGSFSGHDAIAQGFLADLCRVRPARLLIDAAVGGNEASEPTPPVTIGCARWWGRSADDILQELKQTYPDDPSGSGFNCYPRAELERVAQIDPPEAFRLSCP